MLKIGIAAGQRQLRPGAVRRRRARHPAAAADLREARHAGPGLQPSSRRWRPSGTRPTARCGRSRCSAESSSATARPSPPTTSCTRWTGCAARSSARRWPTCTPTSRASSPTDPTHVTFTLKNVDSEFPASLTDYRTLMLCKIGQGPGQGGRGHRPVRARVHLGRGPRRPQEEPDLLGQGRRRQPAAVPGRDRLRLLARHRRSDRRPAGRLAQLGRRHLLRAEADRRGRAPTSRPSRPTPTTASSCRSASTRARAASSRSARRSWPAPTARRSSTSSPPASRTPATARSSARPTPSTTSTSRSRTTRRRPSSCSPTPATPNGVDIKLVAQTADPVPAIATAWQAQMKEIGVNVEIQQVPPDVYYAERAPTTGTRPTSASSTGARAPRPSPTSSWR